MNDTGKWRETLPLVAEEIIPTSLSKELLECFRESVAQPRSYQGIVDPAQRSCDFVEVPEAWAAELDRAIAKRVDDHFGVRSEFKADQPLLIYRYGPGVGFVMHHDEVTDIELERSTSNGQPVIGGDITTIISLNGPDEYTGGALRFEDPALRLLPPAGTLVAFPATRDYVHCVDPIISGDRFTLLGRRQIVA